jgi:hypothetical protein
MTTWVDVTVHGIQMVVLIEILPLSPLPPGIEPEPIEVAMASIEQQALVAALSAVPR